MYMPFIALALVIAAALGGGTAAVAQVSLPGDALWGFKVNVNEGVAGALSSSDQARADWDLNTIQTRLNEASKLSAKGQLTADAQADIAENLKGHADNVTATVAKLEASGDTQDAATIAARYQAELASATTLNADTSANNNANATVSNETSANTDLNATVQAALEQASSLSANVSAAVH